MMVRKDRSSSQRVGERLLIEVSLSARGKGPARSHCTLTLYLCVGRAQPSCDAWSLALTWSGTISEFCGYFSDRTQVKSMFLYIHQGGSGLPVTQNGSWVYFFSSFLFLKDSLRTTLRYYLSRPVLALFF